MLIAVKKPFMSTTFSSFLLRLFSGVGGGLLGTCMSLMVMTFFSYIEVSGADFMSENKDFSAMAILSVLFFGSLFGNMAAAFFYTMCDPVRYYLRKETLHATFLVNIFLFIFALPLYLLFQNEALIAVAGIHFFLSASASLLMIEFVSGRDHGLLALIAISIVEMIIFALYVVFTLTVSTSPMVTILFLPFVWVFLPTMIFLVEKFRDMLWFVLRIDIFSEQK